MELKDRIATTSKLAEALKLVAAEPQFSGVLAVVGDNLCGNISFSDGRITGASVDGSDAGGQAALERLISLGAAKISCSNQANGEDGDPKTRMDVGVREFLARIEKFRSRSDPNATQDAIKTLHARAVERALDPDATIDKIPSLSTLARMHEAAAKDKPHVQNLAPDAEETVAVQSLGPGGEEPKAVQSIAPGAEETQPVKPIAQDAEETQGVSAIQPALPEAKSDSQDGTPSLAAMLNNEAPSLSDKQKKLLEIGGVYSDREGFEEADEQLDLSKFEGQLSDNQVDLLLKTDRDMKSFEHVDKRIEWDIPSLTEEQRRLLAMHEQDIRDQSSFEELDVYLQNPEFSLTDEQRRQMTLQMAARSGQTQKDEFHQSDNKLEVAAGSQFYNFVEPEAPPQEDVSDLDAIPSPTITDEDRAPINLFAETPRPIKRKKRGGMFAETTHFVTKRLPRYLIPRRLRKRFPITKAMSAFCIVLLIVGITTVPNVIKKTALSSGARQTLQEQLIFSLQSELSDDLPRIASEVSVTNRLHALNSLVGPEGGPELEDNGRNAGAGSDTLTFARSLVTKGKLKEAVPYLETFIAQNPMNVAARIELIQLYLAAKLKVKARAMCIATRKLKLTDGEIINVMNLFTQCIADDKPGITPADRPTAPVAH